MEQANIIKIYNETDSMEHGDQTFATTSNESYASPVLTLTLEDGGDVCHTAGQSCEDISGSNQMKLETEDEESSVSAHNTVEDPDSLKYVCGYCGLMFCLQEDYLFHLNVQHGCDTTQPTLELSESNLPSLQTEENKSNETLSLKTEIEDEQFVENQAKLNTGRSTEKDKKRYKCDVCEEAFAFNSRLKSHMRRHTGEKPHKCDVCGKAFTRAYDLQKHLKAHRGEKPYKCDLCEKAFVINSDLKSHLKTHTGEKPHKCDVCAKAYTKVSHLEKHLKTHTGERPYKCDVCEKTFVTTSDLKTHMRTHTGEKPYKCEVCEKAFAQASHLTSHMKTHTGEKPHKCDVCEKSFTEASNLRQHLKTHRVEKPHKCEICGNTFPKARNLHRHVLRTHTEAKKP